MNITAEKIKSTILELSQEYINKGLSASPFDINNGRCMDFADDVVSRLDGESKSLYTIESTALLLPDEDGDTANSDSWDTKLLSESYNITSPPDGLTWKDMSLNKIDFGYHVWIFSDGKHYDAECPEGVLSFFDLPIFKRCINEVPIRR